MKDADKTQAQLIQELEALRKQNAALKKATEKPVHLQTYLLDKVEQAVVATDPAGHVIYWNPFAERLYGWSAAEARGKTTLELIATEDSLAHGQEIMAQLQQGRSWSGEYLARDRAGQQFPIYTTVNPVYNEQGQLTLLIATSHNITERKQAEQEIIGLNNRMELAMRTNNMAWWEMELPSGAVIFNRNKVDMLGFSPEQFNHYEDFMRLVHPQDYDHAMTAMTLHLRGEKERYECEYRLRTAQGNYLWFRDVGRIIEMKQDYIKVVGIVTCIDERKQAEQALQASEASLREANATKDKFLSIIAHDLKNPVVAVVSGTKLLEERLQSYDDAYLRKVSYELHQSAQRLYKLLENLLSWSQMEQGKIPFQPVDIELYGPANYCLNLLGENAAQKQITLTSLIERGIRVEADYEMLSAILRNLISNAIKFTRPGGHVTLQAQENDDFVVVAIGDNGVGISADKVQQLFKAGEKHISTTGTAGEKGTGLGLILCQGFVEKHGGRIWLESQPGQGTTVYFTLPRSLKPG